MGKLVYSGEREKSKDHTVSIKRQRKPDPDFLIEKVIREQSCASNQTKVTYRLKHTFQVASARKLPEFCPINRASIP
jgi:hypothetical protein